MKVSIITVVYNNGQTIKSAIDSVLDQDYENIEYIIVDGASTDNTMDVVQSYGDKVDFVISEPDKGIYDAMNKGILASTGDIVGILNSDDFFADINVVSRVVQSFEEKVECVFSDIVFVSSKDINKEVRYYSSKRFATWKMPFGFMPAHPTFYTYKRNFEKFGLYQIDLRISADFEMLLRLLKVNKLPYKYIDDLWVNMRDGGTSTTLKNKARLNKDFYMSCKRNNVYSNYFLLYSRYLVKWISYFRTSSKKEFSTNRNYLTQREKN